MNLLYYGDNLDVLRRHVGDGTVDLVYLDPPFKSNVDYNVLFQEHGAGASAQISAFEDTWEWNDDSARAYEQTVERGGDVAQALISFRTLLGGSDMLAYLAMMAPRLVELRRVLKKTGSLWLHCDVTASHYLKLLLDAVFGARQFRNEIVWHYKKYQMREMRRFVKNTDRLLYYVRDAGAPYVYNPQSFALPQPKRYKRKQWDSELKRIVNVRDEAGQLVYNEYADEKVDDVWEIPFIGATAKERLGYPTQKPMALMERVIRASSKEGDLLLDPFCGCGTALDAAETLKRRWIGIDITHLAIGLIKSRLIGRYGPSIGDRFRVVGEPVTESDARVLARDDPFQFQAWALGLVGARPAEVRRGGDQGIDGRLFFHDEAGEKTKQIIVSVKAGQLTPGFVRDLIGTVDNQRAQIGVLISFERPTAGMRATAADAGFYQSPWGTHPRIQLLTVGELLTGKRIDYPPANVTFKQAAPQEPTEAQSLELPFGPDAS
jgi:DNA modification methylase